MKLNLYLESIIKSYDKRTTNPNEIDFRAKFDLSNKWVVITGACGLIGRAFCEAIAQFGGNIIVTDLEEADPKKYAEELSVKHNRDIIGFNVNVSNKESVLELKSQILNRIKKNKWISKCSSK